MNEQDWVYIDEAESCNSFFGEVKYCEKASGELDVGVVVMPDTKFGLELSLAALAVDGSKSMMVPFAAHMPAIARRKRNQIQPVAQDIAEHLARNAGGRVAVAYWACGDDGSDVEPVGILNTEDLAGFEFAGPDNWGGGTKLTPIVEYFWEQVFAETDKVGLAAIVTDGAWDDADHEQLIQLTQSMSAAIVGGRPLMKCVLLPLKTEVNENEVDSINRRIIELDELGTEVDIWDHKWIDKMWDYNQILIELVKTMSLGLGGRILDSSGNEIASRDEFNFGIEFTAPAGCKEFSLVLEEVGEFKQSIG